MLSVRRFSRQTTQTTVLQHQFKATPPGVTVAVSVIAGPNINILMSSQLLLLQLQQTGQTIP